jgi:transcription elongation GreA/GreB family factor
MSYPNNFFKQIAPLMTLTEKRELKGRLISELRLLLQNKIKSVQDAIASATESRDSDTKNSAGDKHETARAMVQIEIENHQIQLNKLLRTFSELEQLSADISDMRASAGSIIITSAGNFYLSVGIGKLEINGVVYFAISAASPIGSLMLGKAAGDSYEFQGNPVMIESVF